MIRRDIYFLHDLYYLYGLHDLYGRMGCIICIIYMISIIHKQPAKA
jgi:hypothetical protein